MVLSNCYPTSVQMVLLKKMCSVITVACKVRK